MKRYLTLMLVLTLMLTMVGCSKSVEQQIAEQLELGQKYLAELNYEEAIVAFQKIIELDPKNVNTYIELDSAYTAMSDYEKAAQVLEQGYTATESDDIKNLWTDRQYDLGQAYLGMQDFDSATAAFDKAVELDSGNANLFIKIAEACINQGNSELAASYLEHGINEIGPDNVSTEYKNLLVDTYLTLAKACEEEGDDKAAEQYYDHILELIPDHEEAAAQKEHLLQKQELGDYYEEIISISEHLIGDDISDIDFSLLCSEKFQKLTGRLTQSVLYQVDGDNYVGVYPGGYIYYGEIKDGIREGNGSWFSVRQNPENEIKNLFRYTGEWKDDYPNGKIEGYYKILDKDGLSSNSFEEFWYIGTCIDGYFDGNLTLKAVTLKGVENEWIIVSNMGEAQVLAHENGRNVIAYSKRDGARMFGNNSIYCVPGAIKSQN